MKTAIAAALLVLALVGHSAADTVYQNAITFQTSYAIGPPATFPYWPGDIGTPLLIFGVVNGVNTPFSDLLPAPPYELTFVYENAVCSERGNYDGPCTGGSYGMYKGGTISIYLDTTPDADFTDTSTFRDGELVLVMAPKWDMLAAGDDPQELCPMADDVPDLQGWFVCSGGSWLFRVISNGQGFVAKFFGENDRWEVVPPALAAAGFVAPLRGNIDVLAPVATQPVTWGHVKSLYRQ